MFFPAEKNEPIIKAEAANQINTLQLLLFVAGVNLTAFEGLTEDGNIGIIIMEKIRKNNGGTVVCIM